MSLQGLVWCGEGDLFSRTPLKTSKLYTSRKAQKDQKCQKNPAESHGPLADAKWSQSASLYFTRAGGSQPPSGSRGDSAMTATETRGLPANLDAEQFVLGSILLNDERYADVADVLVEGDFSLEKNRRIYARMKSR